MHASWLVHAMRLIKHQATWCASSVCIYGWKRSSTAVNPMQEKYKHASNLPPMIVLNPRRVGSAGWSGKLPRKVQERWAKSRVEESGVKISSPLADSCPCATRWRSLPGVRSTPAEFHSSCWVRVRVRVRVREKVRVSREPHDPVKGVVDSCPF